MHVARNRPVVLPSHDRAQQFQTSVKTILGYVAMEAVRLSPYACPDNLPAVLTALKVKIERHIAGLKLPVDDRELFVKFGWMHTTERQLEDLLTNWLFPMPEFVQWNERRNRNQAPLGIRSAYDDPSKIDPDNEFIDLYVLVGNVARGIAAVETDNGR
jgi:hypothetical protein